MLRLFIQNRFSPDALADPRAKTVLISAVGQASGLVQATAILAAAIRLQDVRVMALLRQALRPGCTWQDLLLLAPDDCPASAHPIHRPRHAFHPSLLRALDELERALTVAGPALDAITLELLLHYVLVFLDEPDRLALACLDLAHAAQLFRDYVQQATAPPAGSENPASRQRDNTAPWVWPPELPPAEDLTQRARSAAVPEQLPFDGVSAYDRLFDDLARALHRRTGHHVLLTGERGVGKATLVVELAHRAATGRMPFLARQRFLSVDCRYVSPDESRLCLATLLAR